MQERFEQRFLQIWRRFRVPLRVRLSPPLQIRRQQLCLCRVKRKQLVQLYVERELVWCRCAPALRHSRFGHGIKRRVHLDQFEMLRVPAEPLASPHLLWIPTLDKTGVRPARGADKNFSAHTSTKSRRRRKQTRLHFPDEFQ